MGIIPAAGAGSRIQPLAFSKELLPVGSRWVGGTERPRAVSEFLVERMVRGGADRLCFIISPGKSDIVEYYGGRVAGAHVCYVVQPEPSGLVDALFRALPFVRDEEELLVGLPDTVWFPADGFRALGPTAHPDPSAAAGGGRAVGSERRPGIAFLLFPVAHPEHFDAVVTDAAGQVRSIEVKAAAPSTRWIWGGFQLTGGTLRELDALHQERGRTDVYVGNLVNAWLARGGTARGVRAGEAYVDVGTLHGWHEALTLLRERSAPGQGEGPDPGAERP